jgi:hypothetical protein
MGIVLRILLEFGLTAWKCEEQSEITMTKTETCVEFLNKTEIWNQGETADLEPHRRLDTPGYKMSLAMTTTPCSSRDDEMKMYWSIMELKCTRDEENEPSERRAIEIYRSTGPSIWVSVVCFVSWTRDEHGKACSWVLDFCFKVFSLIIVTAECDVAAPRDKRSSFEFGIRYRFRLEKSSKQELILRKQADETQCVWVT